MNEYMKKRIRLVLAAIAVAICLFAVIYGQRTIGYSHLALMLLGVAGILALLYLYNRSCENPKKDK